MWLISLMGALLVLLGALIGLTVAMVIGGYENYGATVSAGAQPGAMPPKPSGFWQQVIDSQSGIYFGMAIATGIWLIMWVAAMASGDSILLRSAKARQISKEEAPQLWNVVEEMTIASGLGQMPRVFIIDDPSPNAFAVGRNAKNAAVAVTSGLLKRLNRDELQGVIAHELGHIRNEDAKFMTLAGVMVGAIILLSHVFLRGMFYGAMGRRRSSSRGGGGYAQLIILAITILVAILAPLAAQLLYFACSRRREYLADACGARYTRYPPGLASALDKISRQAGRGSSDVNKVIAPMYIVNPLHARAAFSLTSTHPPTKKRIEILRNMAGAGFAAYEEAFREVDRGHCIGDETLKQADDAAIREPTPEEKNRAEMIERAQQVENVLDHILPFLIIPCACGVKLKLPPDFKKPALKCPRCGREHETSKAQKPGQAKAAKAKEPQGPMRYRRKGTGWESFPCGACGNLIQLSPKFGAKRITCPKCDQSIEIV